MKGKPTFETITNQVNLLLFALLPSDETLGSLEEMAFDVTKRIETAWEKHGCCASSIATGCFRPELEQKIESPESPRIGFSGRFA